MSWRHWDQGVLTLNLHVQPKASKDEWSGLHGQRMKLRIKAQPIDGRANFYLLNFLAEEFGVSKTDCKLISGECGREKRIVINHPQKFPQLPGQLKFRD
ncbi:MAG: YggU family protein [Gammaproteobacteria bacterium HGW-Gammaproteobacteria-3]|nr:MAG: YggU family protein [Gammaproteobacteria bacterium HGW-Gammaproteobacteria-3]